MESDDTLAAGDIAVDDTLLATEDAAQIDGTLLDRVAMLAEGGSIAGEPSEGLLVEEQARTRRIAGVMVLIALLTIAALPLFGGTPWAKNLLYGTLGIGALSMFVLWRQAASGRSLAQWESSMPWAFAFLAACANTIYFGIYSPAAVMMTLGVAVIAQGRDLKLARIAYLAGATTIGTFALLDGLGILNDPGLVQGDELSVIEQIAGQTLLQVTLLSGYLIGRFARRASAEAIEVVQEAMRELARRDVIANEVREGARRALNIGGHGRASGLRFGDYRAEELIGNGGMAEVYRAEHVETKATAAVKLVHAHICGDQTIMQRFLREAAVIESLDSPNIVKIICSGHEELGAYIVMEYLRGRDLASHLQEFGVMPLAELVQLGREVAAGLDVAALAKIVHRDIKPQNLFLVRDELLDGDDRPRYKILDFGIARALSGHETLTVGENIIGTPAYMAPEQALGKETDHRTDLHALVAVLYRAGTGFAPFAGESAQAVLYGVVHNQPEVASTRAGLPPSLDAFFEKGFAKNPEDRYQSGHALADALARACSPHLQ